MADQVIALTPEEARTGMLIADRGLQHHAALQVLTELEAQYTAMLRDKYGLGPEWVIRRWSVGLERVEGGENGRPDDL